MSKMYEKIFNRSVFIQFLSFKKFHFSLILCFFHLVYKEILIYLEDQIL